MMSSIPALLVAFFLIPFVQKFLLLNDNLPIWHNRLRIGRIVIFVLAGAEFFFDKNHFAALIFFLSIILVVAPAYLLKAQSSNARLLLWMIVPAATVLLIDNLFEYWTPKFYKTNEEVFEFSKGLVLIGSVVAGIMARKQQKAFDKTLKEQKMKLELEEENNRVLELKKIDLEHQVTERTAELTKQKEELQQALETLKATQAQLIQSEKLASLGELTAGIAHEIQNPLNFVTNFSELNIDLVKDLQEVISRKGIAATSEEGEIINDLIKNQEKINYHGKRASSIVKGMLEHSRSSTGQKELIDINKLADEYLRLSYHGLRAKNSNFNADFELIAEPYLPLVNGVPQDIGRVLLNLINNAFQAVQGSTNISKPKITVSTNYVGGHIVVKVQDNGPGMSEAIKAKIFQPFFTTKPSGEGTGLGLSLSYDIVTKGHGGTIDVESTEGEKTIFTVKLPI